VSFKLNGTLYIAKYLYQCDNQAPQGSTWRLRCDETPLYSTRGGFAARIKYIARPYHGRGRKWLPRISRRHANDNF